MSNKSLLIPRFIVGLLLLVVYGFALDGSLLLLDNPMRWASGNLLLYNMKTSQTDTLFKGNAYGPCFSPDGKKIAFTYSGKHPIQIINLVTGKRDSIAPAISPATLSWATDNCIYWGFSHNLYKVNSITSKVELVYTLKMTYSPVINDTLNAYFYTGHVSLDGKRAGYVVGSDNIGNRTVSFDFAAGMEIAINDGDDRRLSCQGTISADGEYVATANYNHSWGIIRPYNSNSILAYSLYVSNLWVIKFAHNLSHDYIYRNQGDSTTHKYTLTNDTTIKPERILKGPCAYDYDTRGWVRDFVVTADSAKTLDRFTVAPVLTTIEPSQAAKFTVTSLDQYRSPIASTVNWAVNGGGTIDANGNFISDGTIGLFTITATPVGQPETVAEALVTVEYKNLALGKNVSASSYTWWPAPWNTNFLTNGIVTSQVGQEQEGGHSSKCNAVVDSVEWIQIDLGADVAFNRITLYPSFYGKIDGKACAFPVDFIVEARTATGTVDTIVSRTNYPSPDYGVPQVFSVDPVSARYLKVTATKLGNSVKKDCYQFQLVEIKVQNAPVTVLEGGLFDSDLHCLLSVSPNPFSVQTEIRFNISSENAGEHIRLGLYDLRGRLLERLVKGKMNAGNYSFRLSNVNMGKYLAPGVYLCRLQSKSFDRTVRVLRTQ
jgi:hypothetical protein